MYNRDTSVSADIYCFTCYQLVTLHWSKLGQWQVCVLVEVAILIALPSTILFECTELRTVFLLVKCTLLSVFVNSTSCVDVVVFAMLIHCLCAMQEHKDNKLSN